QYPLVVGGQVVENKPKGQALRKALAEIDGSVRVVMSKERLSFHDFSQALVDMGARNAIYLVGSSASGMYTDASGASIRFGKENESPSENVNYLVWK
ncbi:MAG: phosphodiester glycosidase family protein, partial [Muribaculaceae bacterium]|nr:phosphodiester glycosidase family protein [Muribaculaceae bacterium]